MFDQDTLKHHIDRSIIEYLQLHEYARFSDIRPKGVDTNLFTYHLNQLIKSDYIIKTEVGYTLGRKGLMYVDRASAVNMKLRSQPKIITMLLVQDGEKRILLHQRRKQPYINTWTLPYGKIHINDQSVLTAAARESEEKLGYIPSSTRHIGDCYIVVRHANDKDAGTLPEIESRTLAHLIFFEADDIKMTEQLMWVKTSDLQKIKLAPAVKEIIHKTLTESNFFFNEFQVASQ